MSSASGACDAAPQQPKLGKGRSYIVMGAPASGKGTQCKLLAERFGFVHLSTGDAFRELCERGTELGLRAKEFMDKGCFVPDDIVLGLVADRLNQPDVKERGCLLDGFPRTSDQAVELQRHVKVSGVFLLDVQEKTLIRRAQDRRIDPETGHIYHLKYVPPPADVESRLVRRDRDDEHSFRQRIEVYKAQVRRVLPCFSGEVWKIDGSLPPEEIHQRMTRILEAQEDPRPVQAVEPGHACAICFSEPADFLVVPCGHQCGCEDCLVAVQQHSGRCPICRQHVQGIQRVFRCGRGAEEGSPAAGPVSPPRATHADLQDKLDEGVKAGAKDEWSDDEGAREEVQQEAVSLVVSPCDDVDAAGGEVHVTLSVRAADALAFQPVDICCVVDVSGSMGLTATYETAEGEVKDDGLSVLDIVKHAVKAVLKALEDGDRLALVSFNANAQTVLELTHMTADGQEHALQALDSLNADGQTNIWGGLLAAMDALRAGGSAVGARLQSILLLTDGQPNVVPPRGHLPELRDYKDTHPGFVFQLNTFGFGYNLDSELLLQLAQEGRGTSAFIPDAVIVGTTFVHSVANVLSTLSLGATVNLMPRGGAELAGPCLGNFEEFNESWGRAVSLGPLQYGQARDLVVPLRLPAVVGDGGATDDAAASKPYLEVVLTYPRASGGSGRVSVEAASRQGSLDALVAKCRAEVVSIGYAAVDKAAQSKGKVAGEDVAALASRLAAEEAKCLSRSGEHDGRLTALSADVGGRMSKALQGKERFNRWGKHYLRALMRAHQLQVCTNFMDPGLQLYGGSLFRSLRARGDSIFLTLPPPKKQAYIPPEVSYGAPAATAARQRSPSPNMNTYYAGAGGGCFAPSSRVRRASCFHASAEGDESVELEEVRAGDLLRVADGGLAQVRCVVRIARDTARSIVALPGGLHITPRHPVRVGGLWQLPRDLPGASLVPCAGGCVYNLVLDRCHVLLVEGLECATWGHGLEGDIIGHAFFGSHRVLDNLAAMDGWHQGLVCLQGSVRSAGGEVVALWGRGQTMAEDTRPEQMLRPVSPLTRRGCRGGWNLDSAARAGVACGLVAA